MKLAVSQIGWPSEFLDEALGTLADLGVQGLEAVPSKMWQDTWNVPRDEAIAFRKKVEGYGIKIAGIHSLFWDQPDLNIFGDKKTQQRTADFLVNLGQICADLGGKSMVFGSPKARLRGDIPVDSAKDIATDFFGELAPKIDGLGCSLCIEALGPEDTDFILSAKEALEIIERVDNPGFGGQLDAKSLLAADEIELQTFLSFKNILVHVHVNDPGLITVGETGLIDHSKIAECLRHIDYEGYVSIEQKTIDAQKPLVAVRNSVSAVKEFYF